MSHLTTHVLNTAEGIPAQGVRIDLYRIDTERTHIKSAVTNQDGRCGQPLLDSSAMANGIYELVFAAGDYFAERGCVLDQPRFVDEVVLRFGISDASLDYHVPLLVSPWSYSTYRGS